jgi:hypothetical protein
MKISSSDVAIRQSALRKTGFEEHETEEHNNV